MSVRPLRASGYSFSVMQIFGKGPKWSITCGKCRATFETRIPMIDFPGIPCPSCREVNILPIEVTHP